MSWPGAFWLLATCFLAACLAWLGVAVVREAALRWNILDVPNARSSHGEPVPLGGGVALVAVNVALWGYLAFVRPSVPTHHAVALLAGGLLIAAVSLLDDLHPLPYQVRLAVQGIAAITFMTGATHWHALSFPVVGPISLGSAGIVITGLWIIFLTNAYNFMDGVDGMVGGQTLVAGVGWVILGLLTGHLWLTVLGGVLAASSSGFLLHNWHPARIFLGDVGSTFLGYSFATIAVLAADDEPSLGLAGVLLVWPAVFDTSFTLVRRLRHRQNILTAHRGFLFHRLTDAGWSQPSAAFLYMPLALLGALLACLFVRGPQTLHGSLVPIAAAACFGLWYLVHRQERRQALAVLWPPHSSCSTDPDQQGGGEKQGPGEQTIAVAGAAEVAQELDAAVV